MTSLASTEPTRRDILYTATGAAGAAAPAGAVRPLIFRMNPDASTMATGAPIEVDLSPIAENQVVKVTWHGNPVFISCRIAKDIAEVRSVDARSLPDPGADRGRVNPGHDQGPIVIGIRTHLGGMPLAHQGSFGGWSCPCHGSQYDASGRIRRGPTPANLAVPPYTFVSDTKVQID